MTAVYNRYRVLTTEVTLHMVNKGSTTYNPAVVVAYAGNVNSPVGSTALAME